MKRRELLTMCAFSLLFTLSGSSVRTAIAKDKDDFVGTIWGYSISHKDKTHKGQFRMNNFEIFKRDKKIGVGIRKSPVEAKLIITDYPPLNGVAEMHKTGWKPATWEGTLEKKNGAKWTIKAWVKDK